MAAFKGIQPDKRQDQHVYQFICAEWLLNANKKLLLDYLGR